MHPDAIARAGTEDAIQAAYFSCITKLVAGRRTGNQNIDELADQIGLPQRNTPHTAPGAKPKSFQRYLIVPIADSLHMLAWVHAIPNGGSRDQITAGTLKSTGVTSGVWDVCIPFPSANGLHNLGYIEFKRPESDNRRGGSLSDHQMAFGSALMHGHNSVNGMRPGLFVSTSGYQAAVLWTLRYLYCAE